MNLALIAGTQSGCGKTSVTLAVLQHLMEQEISGRAFKAGPDFLDPLWHTAVTQKTSYNLDTHMIGIEKSLQIIVNNQDSEFGIIEGVMGLFDGRGGVGGKGSGAHLAKELGIPVWLVVNAKGMSGSIVPLVKGFVAEAESMGFVISGIIANRLGSDNHAKIIRAFLLEYKLPPLIAWMKKDAPAMPERHLGLQMPEEHFVPDFSDVFNADMALLKSRAQPLKNIPEKWLSTTEGLNLETSVGSRKNVPALGAPGKTEKTLITRKVTTIFSVSRQLLLRCSNYALPWARPCAPISYMSFPRPTDVSRLKGKTIAIARDAACCFLYQKNLDWLQAQGAKLGFFSPLAGDPVPDNIDAIWLPGGYPELHAEALSTSSTWESLASCIEEGTPCLAECGGMMMLGNALIDHQGKSWKMAGILPIECKMQDRLASLGYREDESGLKGHEYHHSKRVDLDDLPKAYTLLRGDEGMVLSNLRAAYIHWYFESAPDAAVGLFKRINP